MEIRIEKQGNELAFCIPRSVAAQLSLKPNSRLEVFVEDGKLIFSPVPEVTLEQLLETISEENVHPEITTGAVVGREIW